ncbi:hypothetical protein [Clavibacter michiganensis]|uniref:hypothetical protein n=1 Tax=Clavibacter michiganensis TaxID=28447 RepID=UPI0005BCA387|nr:hypothetical protein [Clavibacter michiganensis]
MSVPVDAEAFVAALQRMLGETPSIAPEKTWVTGRASGDGSAVVLYADGHDRLLGRRWVLERLAPLFDPRDAESLASAVYANEIADADGPTTQLDVDWADGLVEDPSRVGWVVNTWTHDTPPASR